MLSRLRYPAETLYLASCVVNLDTDLAAMTVHKVSNTLDARDVSVVPDAGIIRANTATRCNAREIQSQPTMCLVGSTVADGDGVKRRTTRNAYLQQL